MSVHTHIEILWGNYARYGGAQPPEEPPTLELLEELEREAATLDECAQYADRSEDMHEDWRRAERIRAAVTLGRERLRQAAENAGDSDMIASPVEAK